MPITSLSSQGVPACTPSLLAAAYPCTLSIPADLHAVFCCIATASPKAFCFDLQGTALHSLQTFFQTLVTSQAKSTSFEALLAALLAAGHDSQVGKTAQHNIAQCIAVLCTAAGANQTSTTVKSLLSAVQGNDETASRLALFSLGEIGRCTDLTKFKQLQVRQMPLKL